MKQSTNSDDQNLKEIANFIAAYIAKAKEIFFEKNITEAENNRELYNSPIKDNDFTTHMNKWLSENSKDKSELIQAVAHKLIESKSNEVMYKSFTKTNSIAYNSSPTDRQYRHDSDSTTNVADLKRIINENEFVKLGESIKNVNDNAQKSEDIAKVSKSWGITSMYNFFVKQMNFYKERSMNASLEKLSIKDMQSIEQIRNMAKQSNITTKPTNVVSSNKKDNSQGQGHQ